MGLIDADFGSSAFLLWKEHLHTDKVEKEQAALGLDPEKGEKQTEIGLNSDNQTTGIVSAAAATALAASTLRVVWPRFSYFRSS